MANQMSVETHDPQSPAEWHDHITRYGYVIVHNAVPEENLEGHDRRYLAPHWGRSARSRDLVSPRRHSSRWHGRDVPLSVNVE